MSPSGSLKRPSDEIDPLAHQPSKRGQEISSESSHDDLDSCDQQVLEAMKNRPFDPISLLEAIVTFSDGKLDSKYESMRHAKAIIEAHPPLKSQLKTAWDKKTFQEIRDMGKSQDFSWVATS